MIFEDKKTTNRNSFLNNFKPSIKKKKTHFFETGFEKSLLFELWGS